MPITYFCLIIKTLMQTDRSDHRLVAVLFLWGQKFSESGYSRIKDSAKKTLENKDF